MASAAQGIAALPARRHAGLPYKPASSLNLRPAHPGITAMSDVREKIDSLVKGNRVVLFMKGTAQFPMCGFSGRAIEVLKASGVKDLVTVNVLDSDEIRQGIKEYADWPTIPQLYIKGEFVGGSDIMMEMYQSGELKQLLA
jgi:monothiol glutaredoxin